MNEEKCLLAKKMVLSGIRELASLIEIVNKNLIDALEEYKKNASIDDLDISESGEIEYKVYYKNNVRLRSNIDSVLYLKNSLISLLKIYNYLVDTNEKFNLYRLNKESLIYECLMNKVNNKEFRLTVPYTSYKEFDDLEIDDLAFMLSSEVFPPDVDFVKLEEVLEWISNKNLIVLVPDVQVELNIKENSFFESKTFDDIKSYLEKRILDEVKVNSGRLVSYSVDKLKESDNFEKYLNSTSFSLIRDMRKYESAEYRDELVALYNEFHQVRKENREIIENIDFVNFDISEFIDSLINYIENALDMDIELPKLKSEPKKVDEKKSVFSFMFLQKCNKYLIFDDDTLKFIKKYTEDEKEKEIIDYILAQRFIGSPKYSHMR